MTREQVEAETEARIVAWLRERSKVKATLCEYVLAWLLAIFNPIGLARAALQNEADAIACGEHRKDRDEG